LSDTRVGSKYSPSRKPHSIAFKVPPPADAVVGAEGMKQPVNVPRRLWRVRGFDHALVCSSVIRPATCYDGPISCSCLPIERSGQPPNGSAYTRI
jgi:hypothetical protein